MLRHLMTSWHLNIWKVKKIISRKKQPAFKVKLQKHFLVLKALYFRYTKQTSKNIANTLKLASAIFHFFHQMTALKYEKCFLFHVKSSFHCQDIQSFIFPSSNHFFPDSHWLRGWWRINLKVYDVSNCLNKNLITHFA